ncbi:MAG: hypothetical protein R2699_05030 [Acidimicrobiales bacterium]
MRAQHVDQRRLVQQVPGGEHDPVLRWPMRSKFTVDDRRTMPITSYPI